jgi:arylsulfatase A-like enzyme
MSSGPETGPPRPPAPRAARLAAALAALAPALLALGACSRAPAKLVGDDVLLDLWHEPRKTGGTGAVRTLRFALQRPIELQKKLARDGDPLATRLAPGLVLTDLRDAWLSADKTEFEVDLPEGLTGELLVDLAGALTGGPAPADVLDEEGRLGRHPKAAVDPPPDLPEGLAVRMAVGLLHAGAAQPAPLFVETLPVSVDDPRWRPTSTAISTVGLKKPRLVFQSLVVGAEVTPEIYSNVAACWGNPAVLCGKAHVPNVIVLSVDTLRADHLGCYGYARPTSPNLDALLARGALFEHATSAAPWTLPSYGSLFTGRFPSEHRAGVRPALQELWATAASGEAAALATVPNAASTLPLAPDVVTLAECLRDQGYRTAGLVNNPFLHPARGIDQGFRRYAWYLYRADEGVDLALDWLDAQHGAPFFLFLHLMDPHMPYAPPPPFDERFGGRKLETIEHYPIALQDVLGREDPRAWREVLTDMYDGEIAYADDQIGRFVRELQARGLLENTILVVHADHGEELWDHGGFEHGHALHEELLHVPLAIVYPPRVPAGVRVPGRVRTIDVFPTLLDLLGLRPAVAGLDHGFTGRLSDLNATSLLPWIDGPRRADDLPALAEAMLYGPPTGRFWEQKALYEGHLKLVAGGTAPQDELYDLGADPGETHDALGERAPEANTLRHRLFAAVEALTGRSLESRWTELPEDVKGALGPLGYTGEDVAALGDGDAAPGSGSAAPGSGSQPAGKDGRKQD